MQGSAGQFTFGQPREQAGAERQCHVVEIVAGVVDFAAPAAVAVADLDVGAGPAVQHVREIFRGHHQIAIAIDVAAPTSSAAVSCYGDSLLDSSWPTVD